MNTPTEQLVTCDLCGQGNILPRGLAAHQKSKHCRDARKKPAGKPLTLDALEVLPPIRRVGKGKPVDLPTLQAQIRDFLQADFSREQAWQREAIYDRVAIGLCLLKGRAIHLRQGQKATSGNVSTGPKALAKIEEKAERGFIEWIETEFPGFSTRTARNYMNGARNCGLTSDHGLEDVEALKVAQALHDKTAKELYQIKDAVTNTPTESEPAPPPNLVKDALRDLFATCDTAIVLRDTMEPEDYEAAHIRLHATLEKLTGAKWVMLDEAPSADGAQHGEQHAAKPRAKNAKNAKGAKGGKRK